MNFNKAVEFIFHHEGGYVNDPIDPGGETNFGISKRAFPEVDIKNLTKGMAKHLYELHYWLPLKCDGLPSVLRLAAFDCAVNQGVSFAIKEMQKIAKVEIDGIVGNETLNAINNLDHLWMLERFMQARLNRYLANKNFHRYGKGWLGRLINISIYTQKDFGHD